MAALVVAVSFRGRVQPQFRKVESFPFRIGRAYDNDLILADETVSPHHLQLEQDENGYWIRNLSTENGTREGDRQLGMEPEALRPPMSVTAGHTGLKIVSEDMAVAPTRMQMRLTRLSTLCLDIRVAIGLLIVYLCTSIYYTYEKQGFSRELSDILLDEIFALLMPLAVATATGFISRLLLHHWRFALQLSIASIAFLLNLLLTEVTFALSYFLTDQQAAEVFYNIVFVVALTALLAWQLRALSTLARKRAAVISAAIVLPIFFLIHLRNYLNTPEFSPQPTMHTLLRSGDLRLASTYDNVDNYTMDVDLELQEGIANELRQAQERKAEADTEQQE